MSRSNLNSELLVHVLIVICAVAALAAVALLAPVDWRSRFARGRFR